MSAIPDTTGGIRARLTPGMVLPTIFLTGLVALAAGFVVFAQAATTPPEAELPPTEAVVAMTGASARLTDAVDLLSRGHGKRLLISGVNNHTGERDIVRTVPNAQRWMRCCIDLDYRALNTHGNAIETARWVRENGYKSVLVVTSAYHMPRTLMELRREIPGVALVAHPVIGPATPRQDWWKDASAIRILGLEYAKYLAAAAGLRFERPVAGTVPSRASSL